MVEMIFRSFEDLQRIGYFSISGFNRRFISNQLLGDSIELYSMVRKLSEEHGFRVISFPFRGNLIETFNVSILNAAKKELSKLKRPDLFNDPEAYSDYRY